MEDVCEGNSEQSNSLKDEDIFDQMSEYQIFKDDSVPGTQLIRGFVMDIIGSESCPMEGFGISGFQHSGYYQGVAHNGPSAYSHLLFTDHKCRCDI
jgi:hypothetical protein